MKDQITKKELNDRDDFYSFEISSGYDDPIWDDFVRQCPGACHIQSFIWAELKAFSSWHSVRIKIFRSGKLVAGSQMLYRNIGGIKVGFVFKAPLLLSEDSCLPNLVIKKTKALSQKLGIDILAIQPPTECSFTSDALTASGFIETNFELTVTATTKIDLSGDNASLLAQMRKKTRNNIRKGSKRGLHVREGEYSDISTFYDLHCASSQRQGFQPSSLERFKREWQLLHSRGYLRLFIVEHEGTPVSANWVITFGDTALATRGGWSGEHSKKRPNELMDWHTMKWAKENGFRYYDLEGLDQQIAETSSKGEKLPAKSCQTPSYYKLGFGGDVVFSPNPYIHTRNRLYRLVFRLIVKPLFESHLGDRIFTYLRYN